jgi:hypothetical protein
VDGIGKLEELHREIDVGQCYLLLLYCAIKLALAHLELRCSSGVLPETRVQLRMAVELRRFEPFGGISEDARCMNLSLLIFLQPLALKQA